MHVLVLDDDCRRQVGLSVALSRKGFQATCASGLRVAEACVRDSVVDLLVMPERLWGRLTHALALLAEYRNPLVSTIMLTGRTDPDVDELYLLLPSLHGLLALDAAPDLVARLGVASVTGAAAHRHASPLMLQDSMRVPAGARPAGDRRAATNGAAVPAGAAFPLFVSGRAQGGALPLVGAA